MLRVVHVEDRLLEDLAAAGELRALGHGGLDGGGQAGGREGHRCPHGQDGEELVDVLHGGGLVDRDGHPVGVHLAEVAAVLGGVGDHRVRPPGAHVQGDRVEERRRGDAVAEPPGALGQDGREAVDPGRDALEALGAVVDGVHGRDVGEQRLGGADVGGGLVAADVLLAGLHRHAEGHTATGVLGDADDPAGHQALVLVRRGQEGGVRAAVAHRHAEPLGGSDHDVGAPLAGGSQLGEGKEVGRHDHLDPVGVRALDNVLVVLDGPIGRGVLEQHAADVLGRQVPRLVVADLGLKTQARGAGVADRLGLHVAEVRDEEAGLLAAGQGRAHGHGLGGGGRLVQEGRVGQGHASEVADHRLEVEERLEAALGDLGLIGGVLGVPARVLEEVAQDDRGEVGVVVALADVRLEHLQSVGRDGPADRSDGRFFPREAVSCLGRGERSVGRRRLALFLDAISLNLARNWDSVSASWYSPRGMPSFRRMLGGTVASIRASRDGKPVTWGAAERAQGSYYGAMGMHPMERAIGTRIGPRRAERKDRRRISLEVRSTLSISSMSVSLSELWRGSKTSLGLRASTLMLRAIMARRRTSWTPRAEKPAEGKEEAPTGRRTGIDTCF